VRARIIRMEPTEIHEFSQQMKEAGESRLHGISLAISILAVLVAMVTVLGHRTHTHAVLLQTRAADQWNEYQSRKTRTENLQVTVDLLTLQPINDPAATEKRVADYRSRITKWTAELTDDQAKAHKFEDEVDRAEAQASRYDLGEALLQIAVVLSSVTLLTRRNGYFYLGLSLGLAGLLIAASALFLPHAS
jgi:CHASE2 domain-containing sensor protein